jgi:putative ABC transport system ATP-binding protein
VANNEQDRGIVDLQKVSKEYRLGPHLVRALRDVTFSLPPGVFACIVGPSGSGKSTVLNILGGLEAPTSGEVYVGSRAVHSLSEAGLTSHRRSGVGFVFQFFNLIPNLTALENVALPLELMRRPAAQCRQRARECLLLAELPEDRHRHTPRRLSGGEQQRVAIARALVAEPQVILADEPTGNLDKKTGAAVLKVMKRLAHDLGRTVVVATHDPAVAAQADVVLTIEDGRLAAAS